jgi:hypothetical protein
MSVLKVFQLLVDWLSLNCAPKVGLSGLAVVLHCVAGIH